MTAPRDCTGSSNSDPQWQLRVLNGPARGTTLAVGVRLGIGRASSSDLQLVDQGVSRQHARIVEDEHGRHVLEDLASSNGTFVGGEPIDRYVLAPHTVITIATTELVYEPGVAAELVPPAARQSDIRTLRSTAEHCGLVARSHAPTTPVGVAVPSWAITDHEGRTLVFERPDGGEYEGNLVDDIMEYRMLRAQHLRGGFANANGRQRFESLRVRLQQPPSTDPQLARRAFTRFGCWLPASVQAAAGDAHPCQVRDIGVDGSQLVVVSHGLEREAMVSLTIDVVESGQPRSTVLEARVAWVEGELVGLAFAGAPRRFESHYAEQPGAEHRDTLRDRDAGIRLARVSLRPTAEPEGR